MQPVTPFFYAVATALILSMSAPTAVNVAAPTVVGQAAEHQKRNDWYLPAKSAVIRQAYASFQLTGDFLTYYPAFMLDAAKYKDLCRYLPADISHASMLLDQASTLRCAPRCAYVSGQSSISKGMRSLSALSEIN
jgi:hypothetical protein